MVNVWLKVRSTEPRKGLRAQRKGQGHVEQSRGGMGETLCGHLLSVFVSLKIGSYRAFLTTTVRMKPLQVGATPTKTRGSN